MSYHFRKELNDRYFLTSTLAKEIEKKLKKFPEGRIKVKRIGESQYYYYLNSCAEEKLLDRERDNVRIQELIQKNYLEKVLKASKAEALQLKKLIDRYPQTLAEDVYSSLSEDRRKIAKPIVLTDEQFIEQWQNVPYTPKPFKEGVPVYMTMRGERVRSKSEQLIADRLFVNGIPYQYEFPVEVNGKIIHPDFKILKVSVRKDVYLEHCGMMDNPEYSNDVVKRVQEYSQAGIILGDSLFLTLESSTMPFDVRVLDEMIKVSFR